VPAVVPLEVVAPPVEAAVAPVVAPEVDAAVVAVAVVVVAIPLEVDAPTVVAPEVDAAADVAAPVVPAAAVVPLEAALVAAEALVVAPEVDAAVVAAPVEAVAPVVAADELPVVSTAVDPQLHADTKESPKSTVQRIEDPREGDASAVRTLAAHSSVLARTVVNRKGARGGDERSEARRARGFETDERAREAPSSPRSAAEWPQRSLPGPCKASESALV
jgi:hypothetical protein